MLTSRCEKVASRDINVQPLEAFVYLFVMHYEVGSGFYESSGSTGLWCLKAKASYVWLFTCALQFQSVTSSSQISGVSLFAQNFKPQDGTTKQKIYLYLTALCSQCSLFHNSLLTLAVDRSGFTFMKNKIVNLLALTVHSNSFFKI